MTTTFFWCVSPLILLALLHFGLLKVVAQISLQDYHCAIIHVFLGAVSRCENKENLKMNTKSLLKVIGLYTLDFIKAHWKAFVTGLIGGITAGTLSGCAGLDQADHQTTTTVWAVGVPGVAILRDSRVQPDNRGTSTTTATQVNTLDIEPKIK